MKRAAILALLAITVQAACLGQAIVNPRVPPFYNRGAVLLYEPVIDVVTSGAQLLVTPVVSLDRKYVTITAHAEMSQLISLETFPVSTAGAGTVGGATPAAGAGGNVGPAAPIRIPTWRGGAILNRRGMTRVELP